MSDILKMLVDAGMSPGAAVTIAALVFFWKDMRAKVDLLLERHAVLKDDLEEVAKRVEKLEASDARGV